MTPEQYTDALYAEARHRGARDPIWAELRAAEAAEMPRCANHPGKPAFGGFDEPLCEDCAAWEIRTRRLWLKSFSLVQGGMKGLL